MTLKSKYTGSFKTDMCKRQVREDVQTALLINERLLLTDYLKVYLIIDYNN